MNSFQILNEPLAGFEMHEQTDRGRRCEIPPGTTISDHPQVVGSVLLFLYRFIFILILSLLSFLSVFRFSFQNSNTDAKIKYSILKSSFQIYDDG